MAALSGLTTGNIRSMKEKRRRARARVNLLRSRCGLLSLRSDVLVQGLNTVTRSTVRVHVRRLGQLFNSLDPSPFWDRDLDRDAAEFVESEFRGRARDRAWVLNVTTADLEGFGQHDVQQAVKRYYTRLADSARQKTRAQYRVGQIGLLIGVGVFAACTILRELLGGVITLPRVFDEGLIVLAWIALWLPIEHLAYEIIPQLDDRRFYERLAQLRVRVRTERTSRVRAATEPGPGTPLERPQPRVPEEEIA
jgi:hypothetical protein